MTKQERSILREIHYLLEADPNQPVVPTPPAATNPPTPQPAVAPAAQPPTAQQQAPIIVNKQQPRTKSIFSVNNAQDIINGGRQTINSVKKSIPNYAPPDNWSINDDKNKLVINDSNAMGHFVNTINNDPNTKIEDLINFGTVYDLKKSHINETDMNSLNTKFQNLTPNNDQVNEWEKIKPVPQNNVQQTDMTNGALLNQSLELDGDVINEWKRLAGLISEDEEDLQENKFTDYLRSFAKKHFPSTKEGEEGEEGEEDDVYHDPDDRLPWPHSTPEGEKERKEVKEREEEDDVYIDYDPGPGLFNKLFAMPPKRSKKEKIKPVPQNNVQQQDTTNGALLNQSLELDGNVLNEWKRLAGLISEDDIRSELIPKFDDTFPEENTPDEKGERWPEENKEDEADEKWPEEEKEGKPNNKPALLHKDSSEEDEEEDEEEKEGKPNNKPALLHKFHDWLPELF